MKSKPSTKPIHNSRRSFIKQGVLAGTGILILPNLAKAGYKHSAGLTLKPEKIEGLKAINGENYLEGSIWYQGENVGDGFHYSFPAGSLVNKKYIKTDMLSDGNHMVKFLIELQEGENGRTFRFRFGVLNQCSLRVRMPLSLVDQNLWGIDREGAFLKPRCSGDRVDLEKVDRMKLYIHKKSKQTSKFCITPVIATDEEVNVIEHPVLPKGKLIDDIGQSTIHEWPGKTRNKSEMIANLQKQFKTANHEFPDKFSEMGGWKKQRLDNGTGYFRVHQDKKRWWFIDPKGYYFWSSGIDCVRSYIDANIHLLEDSLEFLPPKNSKYSGIYMDREGPQHINYLAANFIRTFGESEWKNKWAAIAIDELKRLRANTVGNWSEWEYASKAGFPYVRPMSFSAKSTKNVYRDFPDVFHPDFPQDAKIYASALSDTTDDPALIGYFMMNEPKWAFSSELPAVGMLYNTAECATREELANFLRKKYADSDELSSTWKLPVNFKTIESGKWKNNFTNEALKDLELYSEIMVEKYFSTLSDACKNVDPNHLNLGIRYAGVPPKWAVEGMKSFDVFSMNNYREKVPFAETKEIHDLLQMPVIIGEWHFGALDVGLPSSGIGHVPTQEDRGKAYRVYFEDAAANPYCIGVHWFTFYDQSALGRFDGENYNIGFFDICNRPYKPLCDAAIKSHEAVYEIAEGTVKPYNDEPIYLPKLF